LGVRLTSPCKNKFVAIFLEEAKARVVVPYDDDDDDDETIHKI
jgi:hypothetical protein